MVSEVVVRAQRQFACCSRFGGTIHDGPRLMNRQSPHTAPASRRRCETRELPVSSATVAGMNAKARIAPCRTANRLPPHVDNRPAETSAKNRVAQSGSSTVAIPATLTASIRRRLRAQRSGTSPRPGLALRLRDRDADRAAFRHPFSQQCIGDLDRLVANQRRHVAHRDRWRSAVQGMPRPGSRAHRSNRPARVVGPDAAPHGSRVADAGVRADLVCAIARHRHALARRLRIASAASTRRGCSKRSRAPAAEMRGLPCKRASFIDANTRERAVHRGCISGRASPDTQT